MDDAEKVDVREELGRDQRSVIIEVRVAPEDMGKLIGRQGRTVRRYKINSDEMCWHPRRGEVGCS